MATQVEEIANDPVNRQKPLRLASGFELAHLAFPLSGRLMRDFSPVVGVAPGVVHDRRHHTLVRGPVASELVGLVGDNDPALGQKIFD